MNLLTELVKAKKEDDKFEDILELRDQHFSKIRNEFVNRLNRLYTHPMLGDLLDSGEIDFVILQVLEEIYD